VPAEFLETDMKTIDRKYIRSTVFRLVDAMEFGPRDEILHEIYREAIKR